MLYRLEEPIYFYLFAIIPVIIVIFLLVSFWKKSTQKKFASSGLLSKLAPNISVFSLVPILGLTKARIKNEIPIKKNESLRMDLKTEILGASLDNNPEEANFF